MSSIPNPDPFVSGNFSWPELIQESKKRLICSYYDDIKLNQLLSNVDLRYYDLSGFPGFRLGSRPSNISPVYPDHGYGASTHDFKIEYESEPCHLANAFPGFFNIPRTGVYEITCQMTVTFDHTALQQYPFMVYFVKNGTKHWYSTSGGILDPGAKCFAMLIHQGKETGTIQSLSLNAVHKFNAGEHFCIFITTLDGFQLEGGAPGGPRSTLVTIKEL